MYLEVNDCHGLLVMLSIMIQLLPVVSIVLRLTDYLLHRSTKNTVVISVRKNKLVSYRNSNKLNHKLDSCFTSVKYFIAKEAV